jgi:hypothetical protein
MGYVQRRRELASGKIGVEEYDRLRGVRCGGLPSAFRTTRREAVIDDDSVRRPSGRCTSALR